MIILLVTTLGMTFSAVAIWLTLRLINGRMKYQWWHLVLAVLSIQTFYLLSFGPWLWSIPASHWALSDPVFFAYGFYRPADRVSVYAPAWIGMPYDAYLKWWLDQRTE
jgi:hypothetical protein